ncbi:hypothetical protein HAX54_022324, partial [Datura stramonium]|nr:hypothetical protein [Datura stramonium]
VMVHRMPDSSSSPPSSLNRKTQKLSQVMVRHLTNGRQLHRQRCDGLSLPPSSLHQ